MKGGKGYRRPTPCSHELFSYRYITALDATFIHAKKIYSANVTVIVEVYSLKNGTAVSSSRIEPSSVPVRVNPTSS